MRNQRKAKTEEIEITQEMIDAGVASFRSNYDPRFSSDADLVEEIFVSMFDAWLNRREASLQKDMNLCLS